MPKQTPTCPKCQRVLQPGVLLDGAQYEHQTRWMEGLPEFSRFFGLLKKQDRTKLAVTTFRCQACGYLESYADGAPVD